MFFFFHVTATTDIYTLSLHDALPILAANEVDLESPEEGQVLLELDDAPLRPSSSRSEEHTSELQSHSDLVCRLLLEKKKKKSRSHTPQHQYICDEQIYP